MMPTFEWNDIVWQVTDLDIDRHIKPVFVRGAMYSVGAEVVKGDNECMFCGEHAGLTFTVKAFARGARLQFFTCGNCAYHLGLQPLRLTKMPEELSE